MDNHTLFVIGTRGIPNILGGIETHCEELYPRIKKLSNCKILLIRRSSYVKNQNKLDVYKGVILKDIYTPQRKSFEAIIHTFLSIIYAKIHKADIIHIHGIGPGLLVPFAKLIGLKVVVTNHGPDYDRQKWGKIAKFMLQLGERFSYKYSDKMIVISNGIKNNLFNLYGKKDVSLIFNGVNVPKRANDDKYLKELNLEKNNYIFSLGRFVEEKGFHDLIKAYKNIKDSKIKLVIAGDSDHETIYSKKLKELAIKNDVILTGFIKGNKLNQLFSHTKLFILPSYHEGLPIVLLEAMSYNVDVLVSNIPANIEVPLGDDNYFKVGDIHSLVDGINRKIKKNSIHSYHELINEKYNWDKIAIQTHDVYENIVYITKG